MAQSLNHRADFTVKGTSFSGFADYGSIMVGDEAFEFYSDRNVAKNIQIPWSEVDVVLASVLFKGKWIPRIGLKTRSNGTFMFAAREPRKLLHMINQYIPADRMYRSWTLWDVMKRNFKSRFHRDA